MKRRMYHIVWVASFLTLFFSLYLFEYFLYVTRMVLSHQLQTFEVIQPLLPIS